MSFNDRPMAIGIAEDPILDSSPPKVTHPKMPHRRPSSSTKFEPNLPPSLQGFTPSKKSRSKRINFNHGTKAERSNRRNNLARSRELTDEQIIEESGEVIARAVEETKETSMNIEQKIGMIKEVDSEIEALRGKRKKLVSELRNDSVMKHALSVIGVMPDLTANLGSDVISEMMSLESLDVAADMNPTFIPAKIHPNADSLCEDLGMTVLDSRNLAEGQENARRGDPCFVRRSREDTPTMSDRILEILSKTPMKCIELAQELGISSKRTSSYLTKLKHRGLVMNDSKAYWIIASEAGNSAD